jgi:predicted DNA binding protein
MRRVVLELYGKKLDSMVEQTPLRKVESLELLHFLKFDEEEIAAVGRVSFQEADSKIEDLTDISNAIRVELLEEEEEGGAWMILIRWRPKRGSLISSQIKTGGGYMVDPFEFRNGRLKITFVGNQKQTLELIRRVGEHGLSCKVVSAMDAKFSQVSPLVYLTEKQRSILTSAFKLGYYDIPRRLNSDQLAEHLSLTNSTVVEHIRKAERRMLVGMLGEPKNH